MFIDAVWEERGIRRQCMDEDKKLLFKDVSL